MLQTPKEIYQELFSDLHEQPVLADEKNIGDAKPLASPEKILKEYRLEREKPNFDLKQFFFQYFALDEDKTALFKSDTSLSTQEHIEKLWPYLERSPSVEEDVEGYSLIDLPYPYIVPGGRFNEIYYWDSYFTMLGLQVSKKSDLIEGMVNNFSSLIDRFGHIPNGNRSYFLSRSQPPFYSLMVDLLAEEKGDEVYKSYLPFLVKEYKFWMQGADLVEQGLAQKHVVTVNGQTVNRYYDNDPTPRQEMFHHDTELVKHSSRNEEEFFHDMRAACESGWDFSCRWFETKTDLNSISTSKILPVDLNCLLYHLEQTIAKAYSLSQDLDRASEFEILSKKRKAAIQDLFWDEEQSFFFDHNFEKSKRTDVLSLAGMYPLFFKVATKNQANHCVSQMKQHFLRDGGVVCTPYHTGQQWDAPNGWAPLQWIVVRGLLNYHFDELALELAKRWIKLNDNVFHRTGKLMEKYNVEDLSLLAGGGEYESQTGFGWTNGVYLKLKQFVDSM